jgi:PAS domain S-box-containing protein
LLAVPIFVRGAWWGYVGFEEAEEPRVWHDSEVEALTVTANTLAAAITRDLAASELAATQQRYQILVEQIPAMTYIQRASDASILYYSPQVHDVLGYEPQEWGGFEFWAEAIHPDDRDRVLEHDRRTNETGEPFSIEYRLHAKDGRIVWIRDDAVLVRDEEGIPSYWQGIRFDITEQKEAEERLRTAEERYRGIVEHVPAAIYLDSADASLRSSYVSPQILEIAGVRPEEWVADPDLWSRMIHPDDRQRVLAGYVAAATEGTDWSDEYRMRTADGRTIWVHDETTVLHDEQGTPAVIQGVIFDITERKLAEQALRDSELREREAAERLRALDEMKNTFLAAVSHELRSPLTSILGLSLTLERAPDMDDEDQGDLLRRLSRNAHKLDRLLKDLLDIDRLNRGIVEPQYRVTDVGALARRSVEHLDALAGREVAVHTEPVEMAVDPAKTERIVENLLINASRHTPPDRKIWLQVRPSEGGVLIAVDDEGPGVPEALRAEIFQPFRQGPTASPHSPGTGIGLSLVARFAELHGGRAWVEDREGGGASFRVYLPSRPVDEGVDGDDTARPAASAQV